MVVLLKRNQHWLVVENRKQTALLLKSVMLSSFFLDTKYERHHIWLHTTQRAEGKQYNNQSTILHSTMLQCSHSRISAFDMRKLMLAQVQKGAKKQRTMYIISWAPVSLIRDCAPFIGVSKIRCRYLSVFNFSNTEATLVYLWKFVSFYCVVLIQRVNISTSVKHKNFFFFAIYYFSNFKGQMYLYSTIKTNEVCSL